MPTPPHVVEAGVRALRDGLTRYALAAGVPELRDAIARSLAARGVRAGPENVIVTPGAKPMLFCAALALIERGDEVLTPDPGDRKSTRLNSSHRTISYAVFCLKKKHRLARGTGKIPALRAGALAALRRLGL